MEIQLYNLSTIIINEESANYPGKEDYHLLAYLSTQVNGDIVDIRTNNGNAIRALSYNKKNTVYTFDLVPNTLSQNNNIQCHIGDLTNPETREKWKDLLLNSKIIYVDIEPHHGHQEYELYCFLRDHAYQGLIVFDDIWYFKGMRDNLWYKIPSTHKLDYTHLGHWSGTGIIRFLWDIKKESNYTFVTGYFDLTKRPDASKEIKGRPHSFYFESAHSTMAIDSPLIIFCEPESKEALEKLRPDHLKDKTHFILCTFDDFPMTKYYDQIIENRKKVPSADPRNTASYYLFCMARYAMLKEAMRLNPFNSTHFAWINVCIERYGYKNVMHLEDVIKIQRDKVSTCYIDYIPPSMVTNLSEYFLWGRCSLCSGFFTGNKYYLSTFCDLVEEQFLKYLHLGYGHADEQLFSPIYFEHPHLFDVYFGDYMGMITNYSKVRDNLDCIIFNFIQNTCNNQAYDLCYKACKAVWTYLTEISPNEHRPLKGPWNSEVFPRHQRVIYLKCALRSARELEDYEFATKLMIELNLI